jgi:hypothetical protein
MRQHNDLMEVRDQPKNVEGAEQERQDVEIEIEHSHSPHAHGAARMGVSKQN